jgi:acyl dehydratase
METSTPGFDAFALLMATTLWVGDAVGEWFEIDQARINQFADVTNDHQFIHVDPEAAKTTPFGTTIAHGFLTLSTLTWLDASIPKDPARYSGMVVGVGLASRATACSGFPVSQARTSATGHR